MFYWYDYFLVFFVLVTSVLIGIYFGCFGTKQSTVKEYLSAGKQMKVFPIALSVTVSHFSGITLIAVPADVYKYGAFYVFTCLSAVLLVIAAMYVYYPVLFKGDYNSIYEYLEVRFNRKIRLLSSFLYILYENLLLPVIVYTPALALSVGISVQLIVLLICGTCVFYTAVGGLRTFVAKELSQREVFYQFGINQYPENDLIFLISTQTPQKKTRSGYVQWVLQFDLCFTYVYLNRVSKNLRVFQPFVAVDVNICAISVGLIIYANYYNCDPVMDKKITKNDQIVAYYVEQYLGEILPLAVAITGLIDGPSLGLYILGICFPQVDSTVTEFWPVYKMRNMLMFSVFVVRCTYKQMMLLSLPSSKVLKFDNTNYRIFFTYGDVCFKCKTVGHYASGCPKAVQTPAVVHPSLTG
ncbi:sodium-coupled monocarboxylate transporter 1-like [Zophobas morio]|uniref:sodium-coupled monocarboxylate transporter 1-like n=1 Tax=Zophobas morio TaxID=2755281 RepID=UPI0030834C70